MGYAILFIIGTVIIGLILLLHKIRRELEFDNVIRAKFNQDDSDINI